MVKPSPTSLLSPSFTTLRFNKFLFVILKLSESFAGAQSFPSPSPARSPAAQSLAQV